MRMKVYHAHIKLSFQMSLKDYCKTMNMHINLTDLYLLSSGIYKCIYAKKEESYSRIKNYQSIFFLSLALLANRWRRSNRSLSTCCCCSILFSDHVFTYDEIKTTCTPAVFISTDWQEWKKEWHFQFSKFT
jgi:hypothetical protein